MPSPEPAPGATRREILLGVARASVESGVHEGRALRVDPERYPPELREARATFVTLRLAAALRGCTGSLEALSPLVVDVAQSAYRSAFDDPRFAAVEASELADLEYHISILDPPEPLPVASEAELRAALRPGIDGLVLREPGTQSTFLPAVWRSLPEPEDFLRELKRKAGLPPDHWSDTIKVSRYTVESIS